jgi:hypothetical protein
MLFPLASIASYCGSFVAGILVGGLSRRTVATLCAAALFLIIAVAVSNRYPEIESSIFTMDWYSQFRHAFFPSIGFFIVGIAARAVERVVIRDAALVVGGLVFIIHAITSLQIAFQDYSKLDGNPFQGPLCMQSTDYTCGPAAAATVLKHWGVPASEREIARLSLATPMRGTDSFGMLRALRIKLREKGATVRLIRTDWDGVVGLGKPLLADLKLKWPIAHWVVVTEANPSIDCVKLADPMKGEIWIRRSEFEARWYGRVIAPCLGDPIEK